MAADEVRVNGNILSWGSIILKVNGERFYGFKSISFGHKRERVKQYGMGAHQAPRGRSRGKYTIDAVKLSGPPSSFEALRQTLADLGPDGISYGDTEFQIVVQGIEAGSQRALLIEFEDCVIAAEQDNWEENGDPLNEEVEIDCMKIIRNGKTLFDSSTSPSP